MVSPLRRPYEEQERVNDLRGGSVVPIRRFRGALLLELLLRQLPLPEGMVAKSGVATLEY